jgi:amidophosphoribosyltransferase
MAKYMLEDKAHEECGVFGIFDRSGENTVVFDTYMALYALQHRGQDGCGIVVNDSGIMRSHKDFGLVPEVFNREHIDKLGSGQIAIGHALYGASLMQTRSNVQPMMVRHVKGQMALCTNGALMNAAGLREELELGGAIFHTITDAEVIAYMITHERLSAPSIEAAVERAAGKLRGAFSALIVSPQKLIAMRDPEGFRPLSMGKIGEDKIVFASETCAFDSIGATFVRDLLPGEIVVVDKEGERSITTHCGSRGHVCVFEYVYTARPDSVVEGMSVHKARQRAGAFLAIEHPVEADVVIGVPDSGLDAALGYAKQSGIPYGVGFIKNRYIGRTFIQPTQVQRETAVRIKLNAMAETVRGKRVIMVDDSIVRGTTSIPTVRLLREAGAKEVHMRVSSPPFMNPCYFGTDIDSKDKLIACRMSVEEIGRHIGVDSIGFLSIDSIKKIAEGAHCDFCIGCFTGQYPVEVPESIPVCKFEQKLPKTAGSGENAR